MITNHKQLNLIDKQHKRIVDIEHELAVYRIIQDVDRYLSIIEEETNANINVNDSR